MGEGIDFYLHPDVLRVARGMQELLFPDEAERQSEPSRRNDEVAVVIRVGQQVLETARIVPHSKVVHYVVADQAQLLAQILCVRVENGTEEDLGPNGKNSAFHDYSLNTCLFCTMYSTPL